MQKVASIALVVPILLSGCGPFITEKDYFNYREFSGRRISKNEIRLNTEFKSTNPNKPGAIRVDSCKQAQALKRSDFAPSEYSKHRALMADCFAAEQYAKGQSAARNYFAGMPLLEILQSMPAISVPELSQLSMNSRHGKTMSEYEAPLRSEVISENNIEATFREDIKVHYTLMARRDINSDGIEDVILRLRWKTSTITDDTALIALTKYAMDDPIKILWRY